MVRVILLDLAIFELLRMARHLPPQDTISDLEGSPLCCSGLGLAGGVRGPLLDASQETVRSGRGPGPGRVSGVDGYFFQTSSR